MEEALGPNNMPMVKALPPTEINLQIMCVCVCVCVMLIYITLKPKNFMTHWNFINKVESKIVIVTF